MISDKLYNKLGMSNVLDEDNNLTSKPSIYFKCVGIPNRYNYMTIINVYKFVSKPMYT